MQKNFFGVITAYYKEDIEIVHRAMRSVEQLTPAGLEVVHYLIADGFPKDLQGKNIVHLALPRSHSDYGDTPRMMGATLAIREGCYGLMFLDADNIVYPSHLALAYRAHLATQHDIVIAKRDMLREDGSVLTSIAAEDANLEHVDTGCFVFFREAVYDALDWIKIPPEFSIMGDRYFWKMLRSRGRSFAELRRNTVGYTSMWRSNYLNANEEPPATAKDLDLTAYQNQLASLSGKHREIINNRLFGKK